MDITDSATADVILSVYVKGRVENPERLDMQAGDAAFAARYSMLCPT